MRYLPNIEKSAFRRGEYVGYANGVWNIYKINCSRAYSWRARHRDEPQHFPVVYAATLAEMSDKLLKINAPRYAV